MNKAPVYIAGIGCDRGCPMGMLESLLTEQLTANGLTSECLSAIASIELKANEQGLLTLAEKLGLPVVFFSADRLNFYEKRLSIKSDIVFRETGCYGVAEAAALAQAEQQTGMSANLIITKKKNSRATFALARSLT